MALLALVLGGLYFLPQIIVSLVIIWFIFGLLIANWKRGRNGRS